ncbi:MAG: DNA primase [Planctomycetota bacterium]
MARIPEEVIQQLRESADLVEIIGREVTLKRSGASYKGLCPFHEEKTPSFHVFPENGTFKCFGCGEGGNVFGFLMKRTGMSFREALEEISRETGIALPTQPATPEQAEAAQRRDIILDVLGFAARYYRKLLTGLPDAEPARRYLADRGFTEETLETFGVGFARAEYDGERSLLGYAQSKGIGYRDLEAAGLARTGERGNRYDFFRGRIMFPIRDFRGRVIGFGGRILDQEGPKYVNSPDSPIFNKSRELYGQDLARRGAHERGRLLVVEGYTDVMHCRQAGFFGTVAGLGTALTTENARNLRRFGMPVTLLYDGDEAGRRAAERAADVLLVEEVDASVALLPSGQDPADLLTQEGPGALDEVIDRAESLLDYRIHCLGVRHDLDTVDGKHRAAQEMMEVISRIGNDLRRDLALKLLAERIGATELSLRNALVERNRRAARPAATEVERHEPAPLVDPAIRRAEQHFLEAALADPTAWDLISARYPAERFQDPQLRIVAGALHTLRQDGESISRSALEGALYESDEAIRVLGTLRTREDSFARAQRDLHELLRKREVASALDEQSLDAVVRARGRGATEPDQTNR